jgi:hypothetical protein
MQQRTFSAGRRGNPGGGDGIQHGDGKPFRTMIIMRATFALSLLLLSGCAAGARQTDAPLLNPGLESLHINGTLEPVTFAVPQKQVTARVEQPRDGILHRRPKFVHINGTLEPVAFVVDPKGKQIVVELDEACQTNDVMPVARLGEMPPPMPHSAPLRVAPMPNACPVTVPWSSTTVFTSAPVPQKTVPAPAPAEPRP